MPNDLNLNLNLFVVSSFCSFEDGDMTIYVKMPDGVKVLSLLVVSTTTIGNVKMLVKKGANINAKNRGSAIEVHFH